MRLEDRSRKGRHPGAAELTIQRQPETGWFDVAEEISGNRLVQFKQEMQKDISGDSTCRTADKISTGLRRQVLLSVLDPDIQKEFNSLHEQVWPLVKKTFDGVSNMDWRKLGDALLAYPEHRTEILQYLPDSLLENLIMEFEAEVGKGADWDYTRAIELLYYRLVLFPDQAADIRFLAEQYMDRFLGELGKEDWELTIGIELVHLALIFPERLHERSLGEPVLKKNKPRKWDLDHTQDAYLAYVYNLTILNADSIYFSAGEGLKLKPRSSQMRTRKELPPRAVV